MEATPEALADALVRQLGTGDPDPGRLLDRLRASRRPYYTWALAWAQWSGVLDRQPDHETARRAVAALRAVEPVANRLDMVAAGVRVSESPETG
ncbi:MAG: hypothetical protein ACRD0C_18905 [Acidimicrobiia bacterium]